MRRTVCPEIARVHVWAPFGIQKAEKGSASDSARIGIARQFLSRFTELDSLAFAENFSLKTFDGADCPLSEFHVRPSAIGI